ncbi:MAG: YlmC/YmxH family sporulation protein [Oscillospiraceae bacterium]|nr:YlmC/YmxH family sporulation protein [Oscillospiraceae bacterium]
MICRIADLQYKEVIDIADGTRYGFVGDIELNPERGAIESVVVKGRPRLLGLLGRESDAVFPWSAVKRFGEDIILVDGRSQARRERRGR